jgi:hypothetical protein
VRQKASNNLMRAAGVIALLASFISPTAYAQGVSVLTGTVTDASTHQPVSDVVVTATAPQLQGEQIVVTDASGSYRIPQLPPGVYSIRFEKEGYHPYTRGGIELRTDVTLRVNIDLLPEAIQSAEVVVVGKPPTVDVGSSTTGVNVGSDFVKNIAVSRPGGVGGSSRSFEALASVAPQTQGDSFGVSISGATSPENSYLIDGLSVNDVGFGTLGSPMTMEFVDDVNIITGGYMPEYGRSTGGTISATTKSGGNEFHGSFFGTLSPGAFSGVPTTVRQPASAINFLQKDWFTGDFGADVGGYILKDKLWFFAGIQGSFDRFKTIRSLAAFNLDSSGNYIPNPDQTANPGNETTTLPGSTQTYFADHKELQFIGKLTYLISQDHRLSLSVAGTPSKDTGASRILGQTASIEDVKGGSIDAIAKLSSSFMEKKVLVDASLGWHHQYTSTLPHDGTEIGTGTGQAGTPEVIWRANSLGTPTGFHSITEFNDPGLTPAGVALCNADGAGGSVACPVSTYTTGGPGYLEDVTLDNLQYKLVLTYLFQGFGHHVAKAGTDGMFATYDKTKAYSGGTVYREATNGATFTDFRQYGVLTAPDTAVITPTQVASSKFAVFGAFLQDSWNIADVLTLNLGLRWDQENTVGYDNESGFKLPNQWGPRIGVVYDPTRQGKAKIFGNYARFYENVPLDAIDREFPGERQVSGTRDASVCDPVNDPAGCRSPSTLVLNSTTSPNAYWTATGGDQSLVDPNISAQNEDELVFGGEYEVLENARLGASYTRRYLNRVIEDMSNDEAVTYYLGNPGYGIAQATKPKATRNYNGFTVYLSKNFADLWLAQASYTYSTTTGNYPGLFSATNGQLDPNITSAFDLFENSVNISGNLPQDRRHAVKIFAAKEFPISGSASISLGVTYQGISGAPINYLGSQLLYGPDETYILPRGTAGRLPWQHNFDGHLGLNYKISKDSVATLSVDTFNMFNAQSVTAVDQAYTNEDVNPVLGFGTNITPQQIRDSLANLTSVDTGATAAPNPNFKQPTAYQPARSVRFGLKVTF